MKRYGWIVALILSSYGCTEEPNTSRRSSESDIVCGGFAGLPCPADSQCVYEAGTCGMADHFGVCRVIPDACITLWDPVCGCDGQTYGNSCEAEMAGVTIDHAGKCGLPPVTECGGFAGIECGFGQYCQFAEGTCGAGDELGICVDKPEVCTDQWDPVCGCDDQTYSNACDAAAAGHSVAYAGECVCG